MSMTVVAGGDAERVPSFLLRGPVRPVERVQIEPARFSMLRASLALSGGVGCAIGALAFGGYLMIAEGKQEPTASVVPAVAADPVVSEAPIVPKPAPTPAVQADAPAQTQAPAPTQAQPVQTDAAPEGGIEASHQVTTTHFDADPSVWTNVRKFSPFPAGSAPVFDNPPPKASSAGARPDQSERTSPERASHSEEHQHRPRAGAKHEHRTHAGGRYHLGEASQARSHRVPIHAAADTPSDEGGAKMTAEQLQRDGSANPVVNAFAGMFGPK